MAHHVSAYQPRVVTAGFMHSLVPRLLPTIHQSIKTFSAAGEIKAVRGKPGNEAKAWVPGTQVRTSYIVELERDEQLVAHAHAMRIC